MGLRETMAAIAAKDRSLLTYTDVSDAYIYYIRPDFDPVGIKFCSDEAEIARYKINARVKAKITYCQQLALARGGHKAMFMSPRGLSCENARLVFGYREPDREKDTKKHMKYLRDEKLAWEATLAKARLASGSCFGVYTAPLSMFDASGLDPDIVFFMLLPYQAYHVLNDYMGATGQSSLTFNHSPNSAVCSGSLWALEHNTANMTTMCAGSKTSGKTDMAMLNLFIPGARIKDSAAQLLRRVSETGGSSLLHEGGQPWPGMDICGGCPLLKFEAV